jgi:8-oxo-dGTP pyrophosphatase MutT (NUDIX family)
MRPERVIERLRARLSEPLPGRAAHRLMAPDLSFGRHSDPPAWNARPAAVMALLFRRGREWRLPLTVRPTHLTDHAGQICLPGGASDANETPEEAALRELHEELGIVSAEVELLGRLSPINLYVSNFAVTPSVAVARTAPRFIPSAAEVAELIELPLSTLLDQRSRGHDTIPGRLLPLGAPYFEYEGHRIWGATAMILSELAEVWRKTAV